MTRLQEWVKAPQRQHWVRYWLPQGVRDLLNRWSGHAIYYEGVYTNWTEAASHALGYDQQDLLKRVERAALKVKRGEAVCEQDGMVLDHISYSFPLLAGLLRVALTNWGDLSVLDYGGSLGSTYFQYRKFLTGLQRLRWNIIEQPHFVASGRRHFENDELHFHSGLAECLDVEQPKVALLSSVLQYLEQPYELLEQIAASSIEYLLIDRHPCSMTRELLTVQFVPPSLYSASYPSRLFDCERMLESLSRHYELLLEWEGKDPPIRGRGIGATFRGFFLRKWETV